MVDAELSRTLSDNEISRLASGDTDGASLIADAGTRNDVDERATHDTFGDLNIWSRMYIGNVERPLII